MMRAININIGLFVTVIYLGATVSTLPEPSSEKTKKQLSLFSVVTFKNEECTSETTLTGGVRQGTCFTATECVDKSGQKSGNCASGFGVCCVFLENSGASATISQNRTYLRNSEFPSTTTATTATNIVYILKKMNSDICQIRLDFVAFVIAGPANTGELIAGATTLTHCTNDVMTLVQTGGAEVPILCGVLTDEHLYLDLGAVETDISTITLTTGTTPTPAIAQRLWDIKTSQIECWASYRAPQGCHRYFMADYGKIISYNFRAITTAGANLQNSQLELASQNVNTCIRRSKGMCCVEYLLCTSYNSIALNTPVTGTAGDTGTQGSYSEAWQIDLNSAPMLLAATKANSGMVDAMCSGDYVEIPSSWSAACGANGSARSSVNSRYCGAQFGANLQAVIAITASTPVCDCSEPFVVTHYTDTGNDFGGTTSINIVSTQAIALHRGFCLDFTQQTCYF